MGSSVDRKEEDGFSILVANSFIYLCLVLLLIYMVFFQDILNTGEVTTHAVVFLILSVFVIISDHIIN